MGNLPPDDPLQQTRHVGFRKLLAELRQFLPDEQVVAGADEVSRLGAVTQHRSFPPQVYVYPACKDELSVIIRLASQHGVPVYVLSRGRNWGYGAATGTPGASVCIVLERMNRIISVDDLWRLQSLSQESAIDNCMNTFRNITTGCGPTAPTVLRKEA